MELPLDKKAREFYEFYKDKDIIPINESEGFIAVDVIHNLCDMLEYEKDSDRWISHYNRNMRDHELGQHFAYEYDSCMTQTAGHYLALACIKLFSLCAREGWSAHVWENFEGLDLYHFRDLSTKECLHTIFSCLTAWDDSSRKFTRALSWIQRLAVKMDIDLEWHIDLLFKCHTDDCYFNG